MKDEKKTKEQLIKELAQLRQRVAESENSEIERKRMEETVRESEPRFREMLKNIQLIAVTLDIQGNIIFCNDFLLGLTSWQWDEILGRNWFDIFAPPEIGFKPIFSERVSQGLLPLHFKCEILTRQGERRLISWSNTYLHDSNGNIIGTNSIGTDITQRVHAEEMLARREKEIRLIADNVPALVSYVGLDGCYRFVNKRYEEWFKVPQTEIIGKHCREVLGEETYDFVKKHMEAALSGILTHFEGLLPYRLGGPRWVSVEYVPDNERDGRVKGFYALVTDITERKKVEKALRESEERLILAIEGTNGGFWDLEFNPNDPLNTIPDEIYISPGLKSFIGYKDDEFPNSIVAWKNRVVPEDLVLLNNAAQDHLEGRKDIHEAEYRIRHKDGSIRWVHTRGKILRGKRWKGNEVDRN